MRALIERKRKGQKPVRAEKPAADDESNVVDLMDALRRSIGASSARRRDSDKRPDARKRPASRAAAGRQGKAA